MHVSSSVSSGSQFNDQVLLEFCANASPSSDPERGDGIVRTGAIAAAVPELRLHMVPFKTTLLSVILGFVIWNIKGGLSPILGSARR